MFSIKYQVSSTEFYDLNLLTEEDIRYSFIQGSIHFSSDNETIEMDWNWIPLLDFSFCLSNIVNSIKYKKNAKESFEFTESAEAIIFVKTGDQLKIIPSFLSHTMNISFDDFATGIKQFQLDISNYIKMSFGKLIPTILNKYLFSED